MAYQTWIADAIRSYGLKVVEVQGWQTRGSSSFSPKGIVDHHTATRTEGDIPSLRILINGHGSLPGPLCNVGISRSGVVYVIAAGRANHAGRGGYNGMTGNSSVMGIECENNGIGEPWSDELQDAMFKVNAALMDGLKTSDAYLCGHKEWSPGRKSDPHPLGMDHVRNASVMHQLYHAGFRGEEGEKEEAPKPAPKPTPPKDTKWRFKEHHPDLIMGSGMGDLAHEKNEVKHLQEILNSYNPRAIKVDGYYGQRTKNVVINFQNKNGLKTDGEVGVKTWSKLHPILKEGDSGWRVVEVQFEVGVEADFAFGPKTKAAVKKYQKAAGLAADGIVGPNTYTAMFR